jgi:hypothetical protein
MPEERRWFEQWCAYPLQHLGTKMHVAAVLWGAAQGSGKSTFGVTLKRLYGENGEKITDAELQSDFTSWVECRQFLYGEEITGNDARGFANKLKDLITGHERRINRKFLPEYYLPDCVNYLFTSNDSAAFYLEKGDRRFFVHEVQEVDAKNKATFFPAYHAWLKSDGGAGALLHHLLNVDTRDFDPNADAPETQAKKDMRSAGLTRGGQWVDELMRNPAPKLAGWFTLKGAEHIARECELYRPTQLFEAYEWGEKETVSKAKFGRELGEVAVKLPSTRLSETVSDRLYAVGPNAKAWRKKKPDERAKHWRRFFDANGEPITPKSPASRY